MIHSMILDLGLSSRQGEQAGNNIPVKMNRSIQTANFIDTTLLNYEKIQTFVAFEKYSALIISIVMDKILFHISSSFSRISNGNDVRCSIFTVQWYKLRE